MSVVGCRDEVFRIKNAGVPESNIFGVHRIHVMDDEFGMDLVSFDSEVTTVVSSDHVVPNLSPFGRGVELLVDVAIEPERRVTDPSSKGEVAVTSYERVDLSQFGI